MKLGYIDKPQTDFSGLTFLNKDLRYENKPSQTASPYYLGAPRLS